VLRQVADFVQLRADGVRTTLSRTNPSTASAISVSQEPRRNSPSVTRSSVLPVQRFQNCPVLYFKKLLLIELAFGEGGTRSQKFRRTQ
jgi:hypothetical protein